MSLTANGAISVSGETHIWNKHGRVSVFTEMAIRRDGTTAPVRFVVKCSSGYLAILRACLHDEYGPRLNCPKRYGHSVPGGAKVRDEHNRTHCHQWHRESAIRFANDVLKTYKGGSK